MRMPARRSKFKTACPLLTSVNIGIVKNDNESIATKLN